MVGESVLSDSMATVNSDMWPANPIVVVHGLFSRPAWSTFHKVLSYSMAASVYDEEVERLHN